MTKKAKINLITLLVFLAIFIIAYVLLTSKELKVDNPQPEDEFTFIYTKPTINKICDDLGVDIDMLYAVVDCESKWDNSARGQAGEIGLAQFRPATWKWLTQKYGLEDLSIYNEYDQLYVMALAFSDNLAHHWVCWHKVAYNPR